MTEDPILCSSDHPGVKYVPPRHGLLLVTIEDTFTVKKHYRTLTQADRENIQELANQTGDAGAMMGLGINMFKVITYNHFHQHQHHHHACTGSI